MAYDDEYAGVEYTEARSDSTALDVAIGRSDEAASALHAMWDALYHRLRPLMRADEPHNPGEDALAAVSPVRSPVVDALAGHTARLHSLAAAMEAAMQRLDI